jgi:cobyrinic acid a,c-diamide synthase
VAGGLPPRVMVAAPSGRSGKTIVTIGLCHALRRRSVSVQPFKKGPDYIDASWLSAASGKACRNLDAFLMDEATLLESFSRGSRAADMAIIEGNMGLYDGIDATGKGSSAYLARLLKTPVILVVNTARMTRSVAALVKGYMDFEPQTPVAGVILNNVAGTRHESKLVAAVEYHCGLPVLGSIPRNSGLSIRERHLGLVHFRENETGDNAIGAISGIVGTHLDLDAVLEVAKAAEDYPCEVGEPVTPGRTVCRIGVIFDEAFSFYYPENLEALRAAGAELTFVDSLRDRRLPEVDGLYIGGGFPELYLEKLAGNRAFADDVATVVQRGIPVYAECAGLIYLCQGVRIDGRLYPLAGVIPAEADLTERPQGHGYVEALVTQENPFFPLGTVLKGHEFHHSRIVGGNNFKGALKMLRGRGIDGRTDGITYQNLFAGYTHIHALGTPGWADQFVSLASRAGRCESASAGVIS